MSKAAIDVCKRNELWALIKRVSQHHGGDDPEWLKEYAREMLQNHSLDDALACFRDLATQCVAVPTIKQHVHKAGIEPPKFQYQPPFNREEK